MADSDAGSGGSLGSAGPAPTVDQARAASSFWVRREKWPHLPHYEHADEVIGEDECGTWLVLNRGAPVFKGGEFISFGSVGGLMCVAADRWWTAWFTPHDKHFTVYCDIVTPLEVRSDGTCGVDLDLDVIQWRDGRVEIVDQDEFEENRTRFGYPEDVVAGALAAADEVAAMIAAGDPPFDGRADEWWAVARAMVDDGVE